MAKGVTSKKKKEDENKQIQKRQETRQPQQRTQDEPKRRQEQSQKKQADSRQTTKREVTPQAIPVLNKPSSKERQNIDTNRSAGISGVNRAVQRAANSNLIPTLKNTDNTPKPEATSSITKRSGQGFRPDINEKMYNLSKGAQTTSAPTQRSELEEDIAKLAQINTGSVMGVSANPDMLAKGVTGQTLDDYYAYLEDKYHFNRDELDDLALSYKSELNNEQSAKMAQKAAEFGEEHPVLGSVASLPVTLAGAVEGVNNTLIGGITGDERRLSHMATGTKQGFREGAKENLDSNGKKVAYDLAMGLGDLAAAAVTGQAPAILAGNTANEATLSAVDRGQSVRKSALYGAGSGVLDYITNTIGLDKAKALGMNRIASGGILGVLKRAGVAAATEAGENLIQDLGQTFLDELINGEKSEIRTAFAQRIEAGESVEQAIEETALDWVKDRGMSMATGALMGAGMYGGTMGARGVRNGVRALANKAATYGALGDNSANVWKAVNDAEYQRSQIPQMNQPEITNQTVNTNNNSGQITTTDVDPITLNSHTPEEIAVMKEQGLSFIPGDYKDALRNKEISRADVLAKATPEFQDALARLSRGEEVSEDEIMALPEVKYAVMRVKEGQIDPDDPSRFPYQQEMADKYYQRGSAQFDNNGKVQYTGDIERGKKVFFVTGLPASGKSSTLVDKISNAYKARVLDSDDIKYDHEDFDNGFGGNYVHPESKKILKMVRQKAMGNNENLVIPIIGGDDLLESGGLRDKIKEFQDKGWEVSLCQNDLPSPKATGRALARYVTVGRYIPPKVLLGYGDDPHNNYMEIIERGEQYGLKPLSGYARVDNDVAEGQRAITKEYGGELSRLFGRDDAESQTTGGRVQEATENGTGLAQRLSDGEQPTSEAASSFTENGVKNSENGGEVPANPVNTPSPEMGQRRAFTNTGVKSGIVDPWDIQNNPVTKKDVEYVKHKNAETLSNATENVAKYHDMLAEQYASGTRKVNQDQDLDQAMLILGDDNTSRWTFDSIMRNLATHATEAGQFIQAFAKWANTSIGAIAKATTIDANNVKKWESRNRRVVRANEDLSAKLKQAIDTITDYSDRTPDDPQTLAVIRQQVANTIDAYKNTWIRDIRKTNMVMGEGDFNFTDSDIDYLAHMLDHGATVNELKDALNMKVATNRFGISTETQDKVNRLFQYAQEFDEDSREFCEAQAEAFRLLAEEVAPKASALEKFDAWRYIAMLGNPKTMLRNYVGNKLFSAVTGVSNNLAAAMEHGANWIVKGVGKAELNSIPRLQNKIADLQRSMYNSANPERTQRRIDALQQKVDQRAENAIEHSNGIQRTKEFLNPIKDRDLIEGAENFAKNTAWRDVEGSKYERINQDSLKNNRSVFDSDLMRIVEKAVNEGISDTNAVLKKFSTSMAGYMKANGLDASAFEDAYRFRQLERDSRTRVLSGDESYEMESLRKTANLMDKAREYALKQAEYATFHEDNKIADVLSSWSRSSRYKGIGLGSMIIEGTVPFKKTPANILRSGVEYSPFGALKSIAETGKLIYENTGSRKGNLSDEYTWENRLTGKEHTTRRTLAADVIDSWSKTLTGDALALLGYYLFNKGILTSSEKGTKYQDQLEGIGNYAININGHTFTLDWAAPGVMPLLLGAEVNKVLKSNGMLDEEWYSNPDQWIRTLNALLNPILETSMMSGVKDTLTEVANQTKYGEDESIPGGIIGSLVGNTLLGYTSQAIPTLSGQIARTIDPIRRTTDTKSGQAAISALEKQGRKALNKLPFLSMLNPEYRDAYGQRQYNSPYQYEEGNPLANIRAFEGNLVYQMLSPSYYSKQNTTDADLLGRDLYNATDEEGNIIPGVTNDDSVFATWRASKTIGGVKLDPYQLQTFREEMGQANKALREELYNSEWYNNLPEIAQRDIVNGLNTIADKIGQYAVMPDSVNVSGALKTYLDAGGGEEGIKAIVDELEAENNIYGLGKEQYNEKKASGEDLTPYEGFGEAIGAYGANDNQGYENAYLSGGTPAVAMENRYQNTLKDLKLSDSGEVRSAWMYGGREGVQKVVDYRNALEEMGLTDNQTNKAAYDEGGIEALKPIAEYNHAFENAGMDTVYTSESAQDAYKGKNLDTYKEYRDYLGEIGSEDSMKRWEEYKKDGTIDGITGDIIDLHSTLDWDGLGMPNSVYTTNYYARALSEIDSLTPQEFATTYKAIDGMEDANNSITQKELIAYLNKIKANKAKGQELWDAYLTTPTDKTIPVLRGDTWGTTSKK